MIDPRRLVDGSCDDNLRVLGLDFRIGFDALTQFPMIRKWSGRPRFFRRKDSSFPENGGWEALFLAIRRNQVARIVVAMIVVWVLGATGIHLAERGTGDQGPF